jgi:hypothetical protein
VTIRRRQRLNVAEDQPALSSAVASQLAAKPLNATSMSSLIGETEVRVMSPLDMGLMLGSGSTVAVAMCVRFIDRRVMRIVARHVERALGEEQEK